MLSIMRKHAGSWLIKVVLGVIVVVFVFWGVGSYRERKGSRIAVVNGQVIGLDEYRSVYDRLVDQYRSQFGGSLDHNLLKSLDLKRRALDQLINRGLLLQQARRLNFRATKQELALAIQRMPAFQNNGQFDPRQYQRVLALSRMNPEIFEESMREDMLIERMQGVVLGSVKASDGEAFETYKWREEKVDLEYVLFEPSSYKDAEVTPEEMESHFSKNNKTYETPPKVKVKYLRFGFKELEPEVDVSEAEISQYFDLNLDNYGTPKKVKARHILFRVAPNEKDEEIEVTRKKALEVLKEAKGGADFAELARKHSDDPGSKTKGGDLGFFARERMVKPFSDAAFSMKPGEISEPVKTPFGWHIIKVEQIQEAKEPDLAEAKDKIRTKLAKEAARTLAYDRAEEMYEASYGAGHMADAAKAQQLEVQETGFFASNDRVEGIKQARKFAEVAFQLRDDEVSEPAELADGYYILEVVERKPAAIPSLEEVKEKVKSDVLGLRQDDLARKDAEEFLKALKQGAEFQAEAKNRKLEAKTTGLFKRLGSIPGIGFEQDIVDTAFLLDTSSPLPDHVAKAKKGYYVIRLKEQKEAEPGGFESNKSETKASIISQKRQKIMDEWFAQLRRQSDITIEEGFLD